MPTKIEMEKPAGYAGERDPDGKQVRVFVREFTSSDDGQHFVQRLEGWPNMVVRKLGSTVRPSQVDHLLVIFGADGSATVYCNELEFTLEVQATRDVKAGEAVYTDDIADIGGLSVPVEIPNDASFLFLFSVGWRKGLFYDFSPTAETAAGVRPYDITRLLGALYRQLMFQDRYAITDAQWDSVMKSKWFPFVGLGNELTKNLLTTVRDGQDPDALADEIIKRVRGLAPSIVRKWTGKIGFEKHLPFLERAVERFEAGDYLSSTTLLYTRIEGLLRTWGQTVSTSGSMHQGNLSSMAVAASAGDEESLLMPHRFEAYLNSVYFASFDPSDDQLEPSRNTVGHGVAKTASFDKKSSAIGLLIVDQLSYFFAAASRASVAGVGGLAPLAQVSE